VENSHVEGMVFVFLPKEKILFVTDLFSPGLRDKWADGAKSFLAPLNATVYLSSALSADMGTKSGHWLNSDKLRLPCEPTAFFTS
jgi:hypothetical protein